MSVVDPWGDLVAAVSALPRPDGPEVEAPKVTRACLGCDGEFVPIPARRRYCDDCVESNRSQQVRHHRLRYGIEPHEYLALMERSAGRCEACGCAPPADVVAGPTARIGTSLHVDHDHQTGAVRGLLCKTCNFALEAAKEDRHRLVQLASYLDRFGDQTNSHSTARNEELREAV